MVLRKALFWLSLILIAGALSPVSASTVGMPKGLTATLVSGTSGAMVKLSWTATAGATTYKIYRAAKLYDSTSGVSYFDSNVVTGTSYSYTVTALKGIQESAHTPAVTILAPKLIALAPLGVSATSKWVTTCVKCGMPMAHVYLSWTTATGAISYNVYRDGTLLASGITLAQYTDMKVTGGYSYSYTVTSVNPTGESAPSAAAKITAALPPPGSAGALPPPNNLVIAGIWQGLPADNLAWLPVAGAAGYNVYQYDVKIATNVKTPAYTVPGNIFYGGMSYYVTSVDANGMESVPGNIVTSQGGLDPTKTPTWVPAVPATPTNVVCVPEWNNGTPRIRVSWNGKDVDSTYNVYRDGLPIAQGVWGLDYFDINVAPGSKHSYAVSGVNVPWTTPVESAASSAVTVSALTVGPTVSAAKVVITSVKANDDSVVVSFQAVANAVDYRCYDVSKPNTVKYSAGGLSIEMNGLNLGGASLVVEAVDKYGPFQKSDGMAGPGSMMMDGSTRASINGIGDPSNTPNVVARSDPFAATFSPRSLTGSQAFFDNFRNSLPFSQDSTIDPAIAAINGNDPATASNRYVKQFSNDKWTIRDYYADMLDTQMFVMNNHFMDTLYDGGTPHQNIPMHNCNASLVLAPKATADISGGRVLHVTMEVDSHFDSRRWCEIRLAAAGDPFVRTGKVDGGLFPTVTGNMFRWEITGQFHDPKEYIAGKEMNLIDLGYDSASERMGPAARVKWDGTPLANGDMSALDKRHQFDLYVSQTRFRILENGVLIKDSAFPVALPFSQVQTYFVHQIYHTANDRPELMMNASKDRYWINDRPWCDERHWDNMGFEVLPAFPN
jgi:fibronectin type 3 domain-containing protein